MVTNTAQWAGSEPKAINNPPRRGRTQQLGRRNLVQHARRLRAFKSTGLYPALAWFGS
jgi:hypothetical protein